MTNWTQAPKRGREALIATSETGRAMNEGSNLQMETSAQPDVASVRNDRLQITMSPYYGTPDFSQLEASREARRLDLVSVADLLRNAFVYPPHTIFDDVKLVAFGFNQKDDMHGNPKFRFKFREDGKRKVREASDEEWVAAYHANLCDAVARSCEGIATPWLLQSGGKDSTSIAIAIADTRPDATCLTYLGGPEEDEVASARSVAMRLGLRHEVLVCNPGRAYDRYLAIMDRMPLLTADFALLSYADLITTISAQGGDGIIDGLGSDIYFGILMGRRDKLLARLAHGMRLPSFLTEMPLVDRNFKLCFALATLQMHPVERTFPGSRFSDAEVDELLGTPVSQQSRHRLTRFLPEVALATDSDERRAISLSITEPTEAFAKGLYTTRALSMKVAYPYCDARLRDWIHREVPREQLVDQKRRINKVLVRRHIATRFENLPYVGSKGSFRFDLCGLARERFDQVHAFAQVSKDVFPGAVHWLERNRPRLGNKYHASKFYLLAVILPWVEQYVNSGAQCDSVRSYPIGR